MNKKWLALLVVAGAVFLWFGGLTLFELWGYFRLPAHTKATIERWEIEEQSSKFFLVANYFYEIEGEKYTGSCRIKEPKFLNRFAAEDELKQWQRYDWSVWYNPHAPKISSLQKLFPYKHLIYALCSFGLLVYFFLLQRQTLSSAILKKI